MDIFKGDLVIAESYELGDANLLLRRRIGFGESRFGDVIVLEDAEEGIGGGDMASSFVREFVAAAMAAATAALSDFLLIGRMV